MPRGSRHFTYDRYGNKRLRSRGSSIIKSGWFTRQTGKRVEDSLDRLFGKESQNDRATYQQRQRKKLYSRYYPAGG